MQVALVEAAILALIGSLIGAPVGLVLGRLIETVLGSLGTSIPVGGSQVSIPALILAVLVGCAATLLAALFPAWRACSVAPIEAVVEAESARAPSVFLRLIRSVLFGVASAVLVGGFMIVTNTANSVALSVAVVVFLAVVFISMVPTVLASAVALGIRAVPTRSSALRRIGARDAVRNRTRTAATTGALLLATGVVVGLAVFLASFTAAIDSDVGELVQSDLVIDSGTFTRGGLPADLLEQVSNLPQVKAVSGWQVGRVTIDQVPVRLTGIDGQSLSEVLSPGWIGVTPEEISQSGVALSDKTAQQLGAKVGDDIAVTFTSEGMETLRVEGIYGSGSLLLGGAILDREVVSRQVPASVDIAGLVTLKQDTPAARRSVEKLAKSYGVKSVLRPAEFVSSRANLLRGFERVIQWMLLFTLLQALVGVVNTLLLSVGERRREFGLLRAAGATKRQVMSLVMVEGSAFAVIGTLLGLLLGILGARAAVNSLSTFGISGFVIPVPILLVTALAASTLGIIAAAVPARWASAVPPLEALGDSGGALSMKGKRKQARAARNSDLV
ncbi:MAG: FtsX-like permease family protein, partial [Microthrixaceae bacterium]